jgi:hypothetical protein
MAPTIDPKDPDSWLKALSVTLAPATQAAIQTFLGFCTSHMPGLSIDDQLSFLRGIDLHSPVTVVDLEPGTTLAAFRYNTPNPFRLFYAKVGASVHSLGVNPTGRSFRRFRVIHRAKALESRCAAARETWTEEADHRASFEGGGTQYMLPKAEHVLQLA